jgi:hypothetical protein
VDLLNSVEPYAVLITNGDNDSFPVWYAQFVEGVRRDVTVMLIPYLRSEWYARELVRTPVAEYDGSGLPEYAALAVKRPTKPVLSLSPAELDQVPQGMQLERPALFEHAGIRATVPAGIILRDQLLILQMIKDVFPERPVYFSLGSYPQELGLGDYMVTQGFAQKLLNKPAAGDPAYTVVDGAFVDLNRTYALWKFYDGKEALLRNGGWIDNASILIPTAYGAIGQTLARGLLSTGRGAAADSTMEETMKMAQAAHLTR